MKWLLIVVMLGLVLTGCERKPDTFQKMVQQLDKTEKDIRERQDKMRQKVREFNATHPEGSRIDTTSIESMVLDPAQVETLNRMLSEEKDVSYRGLLTEVVDTQKQINQLQEQVRQLQAQLPAPYTIKAGDSHYDVSLRFLKENQNLTDKEARELVDKTALVEELAPGMQIWMLYKDEVFGSYVTQGTALISPGKAQRRAKQRVAKKIETLTGERDIARVRVDSLREVQDMLDERILFLRNEEGRLQSEIAALSKEREEALTRVNISEKQRQMLETQLNSVFYEVDTLDRFKKNRTIDDPLFGSPHVKSLRNVRFSKSQDLRENSVLTFEARAFPGLKKIKDVDVFPTTLNMGEDFIVSYEGDGARAFVKIVKPEAFAGQKVLFALE